MYITIRETSIKGCLEIIPQPFNDRRGQFVKIFNRKLFVENNLEANFAEDYYSRSFKRVLRGLHFQLPPVEYTKLVYCVYGSAIDAVVDIRIGSPTFGRYEMFNLNEDKCSILYLPPGLAHGFYVKSQEAIMMYKTSALYSPEYDTGIRWDSVGIPWPDRNPIISERDAGLLPFEKFKSPFIFKK